MSRIVRSLKARTDLIELGQFIGERNEASSRRFLRAVELAMQKLADMPELGSLCESSHLLLAGLRLWTIRGFRRYVILYRPLQDGIEVIRIFHGSRDLEALLDE